MVFESSVLVAALRKLVLEVEGDLRARVDGVDGDARQDGVFEAWSSEYQAVLRSERTALSWQAWRDERITQAAVAWVLLTVFARYCEDNSLVAPRWIAGADTDARAHAVDARRSYFHQHPDHTDREWIATISEHFRQFPATEGLVDRYSPMHLVAPSGDAARTVLEFWWQQDADGALLYSFDGVDTRFLGDVYQDLSEFAKKTYALLQTPEFVEEFILDQTLEPALADRPLDGFTIIDPTCGSGHFLLGAFHRLHERWQRHAPGLSARELVEKALDSVYGVDINPFAVAIARFRLLVAALHAAGDTSIEQRIHYQPHLAAGDSLLWGAPQQALGNELFGTNEGLAASSIDNADALHDILQPTHDVVVGNPPYITVKDPALNTTYRSLYKTCHRQYALTVPFMELFFHLARTATRERPAGWVGQITSNSFMKREFGSKLIEQFLPTKDLRQVIDTSGAYIPGHGTPTVIIIGRNTTPLADTIRAVLGIRGEPGRPNNPAHGLVWTTITQHINQPRHEDTYISITDLPRTTLTTHPWSLTGGGATALSKAIGHSAKLSLASLVTEIGFGAVTREDSAYMVGNGAIRRANIPASLSRPMVEGDNIREWSISGATTSVWPYNGTTLEAVPTSETDRFLWPYKPILKSRVAYGSTQIERGLTWFEYSMFFAKRYRVRRSISFAFVTTHNHFVLDRGGKVFKQSAPVIKLPEGASEDDHLRLLGVLNSSVACFWLKQNSHNKGSTVDNSGARTTLDAWENFYEYTGTTLKDFPLPTSMPLKYAQLLDTLATQLAGHSPASVVTREIPTAQALATAHTEWLAIRSKMIAIQDELDWDYYRIYGLTTEDFTFTGDMPGIASGERAFEIVLARRIAQGSEEPEWFNRHNSTPVTEIPSHLPEAYRELLQRRLDAIETNPHIRLLERPEYKRRWAVEPWDKQVTTALRNWLLDRLENRELWYDRDERPTVASIGQLADRIDRDPDFQSVLHLWAGDNSIATATALTKLLADQHVPFLSAYRYKPAGLDKRAAWEHTWNLQRREDNGETLDTPIPVPPKYKPTDFTTTSYWTHRGKLDVPKERFTSYPGASRDTDPTLLLGWAGWDHGDKALALATLITDRTNDGWTTQQLTPLLAGLHELTPWLRQWHNQIDPDYGESLADTINDELHTHLTTHHLTTDQLHTWKPTPKTTRKTKS
nr:MULTISPECIES: BREX-2 system adenine-specific DNA-methyltransferase PglX [Actinomycetes]